MKHCTKCKQDRTDTEFYKDARRKDGLRAWCKSCTKADSARREGKYAEKRKAYRESKHGQTVSAAAHRKAYAANKNKILAQNRAWRQTLKGRLSSYRKAAEKRGYPWELSDEQFAAFWEAPCEYCGDEIKTVGIDRTDNTRGYVVDNVKACCSTCNKMKMTLTEQEFVGKLHQILNHLGD